MLVGCGAPFISLVVVQLLKLPSTILLCETLTCFVIAGVL